MKFDYECETECTGVFFSVYSAKAAWLLVIVARARLKTVDNFTWVNDTIYNALQLMPLYMSVFTNVKQKVKMADTENLILYHQHTIQQNFRKSSTIFEIGFDISMCWTFHLWWRPTSHRIKIQIIKCTMAEKTLKMGGKIWTSQQSINFELKMEQVIRFV